MNANEVFPSIKKKPSYPENPPFPKSYGLFIKLCFWGDKNYRQAQPCCISAFEYSYKISCRNHYSRTVNISHFCIIKSSSLKTTTGLLERENGKLHFYPTLFLSTLEWRRVLEILNNIPLSTVHIDSFPDWSSQCVFFLFGAQCRSISWTRNRYIHLD